MLGSQLDRLGAPFYPSYRERRARSVAPTATDEVLTRATAGHRATHGRPAGFGADAEQAGEGRVGGTGGSRPPAPPACDYGGMSAAGREALDDGRATVLAVLSQAYAGGAGRGPAGPWPAPAAGEPGHATAARADPSDTVTRVLGAPPPAGAAAAGRPPAAGAAAARACRRQYGPR